MEGAQSIAIPQAFKVATAARVVVPLGITVAVQVVVLECPDKDTMGEITEQLTTLVEEVAQGVRALQGIIKQMEGQEF